MEAAAPRAKPGREPPPVPPNYVSLRHLQELRLKEKEEQERRQREEEEAAAAAAAKREAEEAARAAAIKREAALKAEAKGRAASWEASGGAKEWHRGGKAAQGQGHQWVAVAHRAPATPRGPMARGQGAAGKREAAIGGGHGEKGAADDVPANAPRGGGKPLAKGKGKWKGREEEKRAEAASAPSHGGKAAEVASASPCGGKPESKGESKAKGKAPGNQAAESGSTGGGPGEQVEAPILSSRDRFRRGRRRDPAGRGAETCTGVAPVKTAGPSPPRGVKSDGVGKPKPPAPRRADAVAGGDSPDGKKTAPAQAPPPSAADGGSKPTTSGELRKTMEASKPTSGGELRKTMEAKPGGVVEGQRRRLVVEAHAVAELNIRGARCSAGEPWRGRVNDAAEQHGRGRVWVPKAAAAGSSAGAGL